MKRKPYLGTFGKRTTFGTRLQFDDGVYEFVHRFEDASIGGFYAGPYCDWFLLLKV